VATQKVEVDQRIAMLIEEYNTLVDERRFAEAEAIAKKAGQLAPDNAVVRQLLAQSRMIRRLDAQKSIDGERQAGFLDVAEDVEASGTPFAGPIKFPETKDWQDLTKSRSQRLAEGRSRATAAEVAILKKLDTQVKPGYRGQPLAVVKLYDPQRRVWSVTIPRRAAATQRLDEKQATAIAARDPKAADWIARYRDDGRPVRSTGTLDLGTWRVKWYSLETQIAEVGVADTTGRITYVRTGPQVAWSMARGGQGFGRLINEPWAIGTLIVLFSLVMLDWRRLRSMW
jgi:hypothetical protein